MENIVDGFSFYTAQDAELALQEQKKIAYLEAHMDYHNPESILKIYQKALRERIFKTPLGVMYLKQLQQFLEQQENINPEEIPPIALYAIYDEQIRKNATPARQRVQPPDKKEKSNALTISVTLNVALVIAIIAMFVITLNSGQPNILNYEKNLVNKYAAWEQELTEREQAVREKELELHLQEEP